MSVSRMSRMIAAACLVAALGAPAIADDDDGSSGWRGGWGMHQMLGRMGRGGMGGCMMGYGPGDMLDRIDGRLAFIKAELKITEAQSGAWSDLAEKNPGQQRDSQRDAS